MAWKTERSYPGKTATEVYQATKRVIDGLAERYGLKHVADDQACRGKVTRTGVNGSYHANGDRISIELEFAFLIPGMVRTKVQDEVNRQLDKLF